MIYDHTTTNLQLSDFKGDKGFAIHSEEVTDGRGIVYIIFTDDGYGNGNYVCESTDKYWIDKIAVLLDSEE